MACDVAAGDVEVAGGPERGVHRVREQPSIVSARLSDDSIGEEVADLARRRQRADHVERDPAEELGVTGRGPRASMPRARSLA